MRRALFTATSLLTAVALAGCGADAPKQSSGRAGSAAARRLLVQAFAGHHAIKSGVIGLDLKLAPSGSGAIGKPIELSFGGPFTTTGAGKPPQSDFTIAIAANGHRSELQLISAGGQGYITVSGQSYRMPAASIKRLESGFGALASPGTAPGADSGAFTKLGIKPLDWLVDPRIVGSAGVEGVRTTRIRARLDATALLSDLSRLLGKAGTPGSKSGSPPGRIPAATQRSIAHALGAPRVSIWTGAADKLLRKLSLTATFQIPGRARHLLGGLRAATVTLDFEYGHLNQPQTITAPSVTKPFSALRAQVTTVLRQIGGGLSSAAGVDRNYTRCITAAAGDVAKMQRCSQRLGGG